MPTYHNREISFCCRIIVVPPHQNQIEHSQAGPQNNIHNLKQREWFFLNKIRKIHKTSTVLYHHIFRVSFCHFSCACSPDGNSDQGIICPEIRMKLRRLYWNLIEIERTSYLLYCERCKIYLGKSISGEQSRAIKDVSSKGSGVITQQTSGSSRVFQFRHKSYMVRK